MTTKIHANEANIDVALVQRLIGTQFPEWATLPVKPLVSAGTDNAIYRLGDTMAVRMPLIQSAASHIGKEYEWLPKLAPHLPFAVPLPLVKGAAAKDYPWPWYVYHWLDGRNAIDAPITDLAQAATDMGSFVAALEKVETTGAPASRRGRPLTVCNGDVRSALTALDGAIDTSLATQIWEQALTASKWHAEPVWIHGDLHASNVLTQNGQLSAVIDFGTSGIGDPACDMMVAWTILSTETRDLFRKTVCADDATWLRGKGWALAFGLIALPYYQKTNPVLASIAKRTINKVLADTSI